MTKLEEMTEVRSLAAKLGDDSYLGPWLLQISYELESLMRSDFLPQISLRDAERRAAEVVAAADLKAASISENANRYAVSTIEKANATARAIRETLLRHIDKAERDLTGAG